MDWTTEMTQLANAHDFLMAEHGAQHATLGAELVRTIMAKSWDEGHDAAKEIVRDTPNPYRG